MGAYRQVNCHDLCYEDYLKSKNISISRDFIPQKNCKSLCPLECDSVDFDYSSESNSGYNNWIVITFHYKEIKYTQMSQTPKMTLTDFISNFGGILGVFLELSFYSFYKFMKFAFERLFIVHTLTN